MAAPFKPKLVMLVLSTKPQRQHSLHCRLIMPVCSMHGMCTLNFVPVHLCGGQGRGGREEHEEGQASARSACKMVITCCSKLTPASLSGADRHFGLLAKNLTMAEQHNTKAKLCIVRTHCSI